MKKETSFKRLYQNRVAQRNHTHGNWRQVVVDCLGMCIHKDENNEPCCSINNLQLHEPFGEDHTGWGTMQARVLMCYDHHMEEHQTMFSAPWAPKISMILEDVSLEILIAGSYDKWIEKFGLVDRPGILLYN